MKERRVEQLQPRYADERVIEFMRAILSNRRMGLSQSPSLSLPIAHRVVRLGRFTPKAPEPRPERQETLQSVVASTIGFVAFVAATLATLGRFVPTDTLIWIVGLFSAAFGLGARPLIGDVLTGIGFVFEDTLSSCRPAATRRRAG
jgi:small-conductance mechanosensitive channel